MIEMASVLTSKDAVETMRSTQEALNVTSAFLKEFGSYVTKQVSMTRKSSLRVMNGELGEEKGEMEGRRETG